VLFDRYFADILADPLRYRISGVRRLAQWLQRLIPQPDLYLVLLASSESILDRKQEVSTAEIERQLHDYAQWAAGEPRATLVSSDGGIQDTQSRILAVAWGRMEASASASRFLDG
jgi:hypothetical protein